MKSIYIVLTRTGTALSRAISAVTLEPYTHASLSMDPTLSQLYTFSRLYYKYPLPAGFTIESPYTGYMKFHPETPCEVYELRISDTAYYKIKRKINFMATQANIYRYSILGTLYCMFSIKHKRPNHYFCSQFIGELLRESGAATLPKHESLMHPADYRHMPECRLVYHGNVHGLVSYYLESTSPSEEPENNTSETTLTHVSHTFLQKLGTYH